MSLIRHLIESKIKLITKAKLILTFNRDRPIIIELEENVTKIP
jgi:hypothetical protein